MHDERSKDGGQRVVEGTNPQRSRWFYVWCLPVLWVLPVAMIWGEVAVMHNTPGDHCGIIIAIAALPVFWIVDPLLHGMSDELSMAVLTCSIGMALTIAMGFFQDLLRVPRPGWKVVVYFVVALVLFGLIFCGCEVLAPPSEALGVLLMPPAFLVLALPNLVLVYGLGAILVYAVVRAFSQS